MQALIKRSLHFRNPNGKGGKNDILVHASPNPQALPNWVRNTKAFEFASSDHSLIEVTVKEAPAPKKQDPNPDELGFEGNKKGNKKDEGKKDDQK